MSPGPSFATRHSSLIALLQVTRSGRNNLNEAANRPQHNSRNPDPVLVKMPVQPRPYQPPDHARRRQRNRQLNHGLSLHQLAQRVLLLFVRHSEHHYTTRSAQSAITAILNNDNHSKEIPCRSTTPNLSRSFSSSVRKSSTRSPD